MTAARECEHCGGFGIIGRRTCGHHGNCPCDFEEIECVCVLREWAKAALIKVMLTERDNDLRAHAGELYQALVNGEEEDWLWQLIRDYDEQRERRLLARLN